LTRIVPVVNTEARRTGMLSSDDFNRVRSTGLPVCLPSEVPAGTTVIGVEVDTEDSSYLIRLFGPQGQTLMVYAAAGLVGDVFRGEDRRVFRNAVFGDGVLELYADPSEGVDFRTHWLSVGGSFPMYGMSGKGFDATQAVAMAESLVLM